MELIKEKEKLDWKQPSLFPIEENEDGTNNYNEFKQKSELELDAAGYWKYIGGTEYNPPRIPDLAVPPSKLYLVWNTASAHDACLALKREYEPANTLTAININQQIIGNACPAGGNPVSWLQSMVQLYNWLRETNPNMMLNVQFTKHLIT
ncbi:hypothetical protein BT96DRAFT_1001867 [Gymnopus androsaceus JB14]|uniref:Uncharacterized protein n=1 Tax=Gymnopus androsaceus JB14 TaxID=1447944 RepID=A0A6A4GYB4_9AGAR|nr:hypothetical protein BT96DRAFT_1001867 [Gymnopus androsaceus JB14]